MPHPSTDSAYGIWSLNEVRDAERGDNWPALDLVGNGVNYATSYLATTGGSLINANASSLNSIIDGASDGDAILLPNGTYTLDTTDEGTGSNTDTFRGKNILICGATSAENVIVSVDHDGTTTLRDNPVFGGEYNTVTQTLNRQLAFLTYKRVQTDVNNYASALVKGFTPPPKGRMVNCYLDNNNGNISWHYDNQSLTTIDVDFIRCTFANYASWLGSYSGRDDVLTVSNCLFDDTTDQTEYVDGGGNVVSATVNTTTRTYDTATYTTAGHLYVPNTTAVF